MDRILLSETQAILRRTANQGVDMRQKEAYYEMSRSMNVVLKSMQEQQNKLRQIVNVANEVHNNNLADTLHQIAKRMNQEIQEAEAVMHQMRNIANN